jgi:hypothetical protein
MNVIGDDEEYPFDLRVLQYLVPGTCGRDRHLTPTLRHYLGTGVEPGDQVENIGVLLDRVDALFAAPAAEPD